MRVDDSRLASLMREYQSGDAAAFDELYRLVYDELTKYLVLLSGDPHVAEDCAQESFLAIHRARHTYSPSRPFRPWAYAVARHVYLMERRARTRRRRHEHRFPPVEWCLSPEVERLVSRDALRKVLASLRLKAREALVLHYALGLSFAEIGALTGTHPGTAKMRAHRALLKARELSGKADG